MNLQITASSTKEQVFSQIAETLAAQGFTVVQNDFSRPWGGFFVIDETQAPAFIKTYFPGMELKDFTITHKLSPKILVVAPSKRLSWQYHFRRAEIWRVVAGEVGVVTSLTDEEGPLKKYQPGDLIKLQQGERHRLVGLETFGIIAEIWQHTDESNPSNEDDIVRLQDDFGR
jgi:mannose-6-phosphate isomerase-like protein (cupin superfamily)